MSDYVIGHYEEYFYDMMEAAIGNVLNSVNGCMMGDDIYKLVAERLEYEFRLLKTATSYLSFDHKIKIYGDDVVISIKDRVMKKCDICKLHFNKQTGYIDVDWVG